MIKKIRKWTLIFIGSFLMLIICFIVWFNWGYYDELNQIKKDLNAIEGVKVLNIWGHEDIELEEISARVEVDGKGVIVINDLSKDVFNPEYISLTEINGKSFEIYSCSGSMSVGESINIGTSGLLSKQINKVFHSPKEILDYFDEIEKVIDSLPRLPKFRHFETENFEKFIGVIEQKSEDKDKIFNLIGVEEKFEFAKTLDWNNKDCFQ